MKPLDDDPLHYVSAEPAQYALEVNQGFFEECRVEVADRARLPHVISGTPEAAGVPRPVRFPTGACRLGHLHLVCRVRFLAPAAACG
jgi:hypothetical protein